MQSYGNLLKKTREEKNITIETVSRELTITRQYIAALEEEDDSVFPGETYVIGFLKNYGDYLGLDGGELIKLYHAKCTQESPVPQALLAREKPKFLVPLIAVLSALILVGFILLMYFVILKVPQKKIEEALKAEESKKIHQYQYAGDTFNRRLYKGDQILISQGKDKGDIVLTVTETLKHFSIETPAGNQMVELSEERELDIDGDGKTDFIIYLSEVSTSDESFGAEIRMLQKTGEKTAASTKPEKKEEVPVANVVSKATGKRTVIHESNRAYPFTISIDFRGSSMVRYRVDRQTPYESYYKKGERITINPSNGARLWISNINAMKIQIIADQNSYDLDIGRAGEVQVEDIKWVRDSDGRYRLVVEELD